PFLLEDRFRRSAGDWFELADCAILSDLAQVQPRAVPRHVGMIPGEPCEPPSIRREPRRSIEIVPTREHVSGPTATTEIDRDDGIDRLAAAGVALAHADPAATVLIDPAVGEAPLPLARGRLGRKRLRLERAWHLPIQAAVREIGEIDRPVPHGPWSTTVFVHARARNVRARRH